MGQRHEVEELLVIKENIDKMGYEQLLLKFLCSKRNDPYLVGEAGRYFRKSMKKRMRILSKEEQTKVNSKIARSRILNDRRTAKKSN